MNETLQLLFSKENITLLGSASAWLYTFIKSRKRFDIKINEYRLSPHGLLLHAQFSNNSTLPLSINDISVLCDKEYFVKRVPEKVLERTSRIGKEVKSHKEFYSIDFPINLASLSGESGYLLFPSGEEPFPQLSNSVTLIVRTNRGREVKKTLPLGNQLLR